jgi:pimeloyl-ACP methyl ester carboxylesterase
MTVTSMSIDRRSFLQHTGAALAMASSGSVLAQQQSAIPPSPPAKTVKTSILEIGYHESGPASGLPVIMLHGFPDDAHAYDGVAPILAKAGHRALAMHFRGYGPTRFLDPKTPRTAEQAAIGQDVIDFADALKLKQFVVAGFDWGGRAACIAAALHPERVRAAVLIGGYTIQNTVTPSTAPPNPEAVRRGWYQWYLNTEVGRAGLESNRRGLCEMMWRDWSPNWHFSDAMFAQTAASFDNPDFIGCVVHSYRHRTFNAAGEARFLDIEKKLATRPPVSVPAIVLHGGADPFGAPTTEITAADRTVFPKLIDKRIVTGAGHFVPHEMPGPVAQAIIDVIKSS